LNDVAREPRLRLRGSDVQRLLEQVVEYLVPVDQPLVLVSQIQRCGGTLLSQLLDGHPELHVHPSELHIGHPRKDVWPEFVLAAGPKQHFETLVERPHKDLFAEGYRKRMREHEQYDDELFPFLQPPSLLASLFRLVVPRQPARVREILDAYFTAYFNAWLDNRHLRDGPKRWIAAFTPRLAWDESRARFFADYPDGRLIAVLRDPHDWYASARAHHRRYSDCEQAITEWVLGAHEIAAAARERPDSTLVLRFEDLVRETRPAMALVADWLGIARSETLAQPTFNDLLIRANSSFTVSSSGIVPQAVGRGRSLSRADAALIERLAHEPYAQALALTRRLG
jgi:hypothetical protein